MNYKMIVSFLFIISIIHPVTLWGQYKEIRGKVLDNKTQEAIPYSSISVKSTLIGTSSNSRGEFIFYFPDSLIDHELTISCIGYKTQSIKLKLLNTSDIVSISLIPESYEIGEVVVGPNPPTATDIVKQAIRKLHKNYQRSPYYMEGFLRDKVLNLVDNKNTRLSEAAVEIVKKEFGNENNADRVKVIEIRNSYNYSKLGSWWKEKIAQTFWGYSTENPAYATLQYRDYTDPKALRELVNNDLYNISILGYTMYDGKPVVIIDFKEEYFKFMFQKWPSKYVYSRIRLYIDTESYAMLKTEFYAIDKNPKENDFKLYFKQDTIGTFAVKQYEKLDGQYYLKYAGYFGRIHDQPDVNEAGKSLYFNETELLINRLITSRKEFDRIKHRDLLEKDVPLWDMKYVYDPSFWKNYNILIDKPLDPTVLKDLEQEVPLYDQFIDAGAKNSKKEIHDKDIH